MKNVTLNQIRSVVDDMYIDEPGFDKTATDITFQFVNDADDIQLVRVVLGNEPHRVGIHLTGGFDDVTDFEFRLFDAIETALKDNYPAIYIHSTKIGA